jgi:hypothetical protein
MNARVVVVEVFDSRHTARSRKLILLSDTKRAFTIGRSVFADVSIEDDYAAAMHVRIDVSHDGLLQVTDLGSINGIRVGGTPHRAAASLPLADDLLHVGSTRFRIRVGEETLEPEKIYRSPTTILASQPALLCTAGIGFTLAQLTYTDWVSAPRDLIQTIFMSIAIAATCVAMWVAVWSVLSRIMVGEWRWFRHGAIALLVAVLFNMIEGSMDIVRFMLGWPIWKTQYVWFAVITLGVMLHLHLINASTLSWRRAAIAGYLIPAVLAVGGLWLWDRHSNRDVNMIEAQAPLYPPQLRLSKATEVSTFFKNADGLRIAADAKLKAALIDDPEGTLATSRDDG